VTPFGRRLGRAVHRGSAFAARRWTTGTHTRTTPALARTKFVLVWRRARRLARKVTRRRERLLEAPHHGVAFFGRGGAKALAEGRPALRRHIAKAFAHGLALIGGRVPEMFPGDRASGGWSVAPLLPDLSGLRAVGGCGFFSVQVSNQRRGENSREGCFDERCVFHVCFLSVRLLLLIVCGWTDATALGLVTCATGRSWMVATGAPSQGLPPTPAVDVCRLPRLRSAHA
jgi:hypothetical protein